MSSESLFKALDASVNHFMSCDSLSVCSDGTPPGPVGPFSVHPYVSVIDLKVVVAGFQVEYKKTNDEPGGAPVICLGEVRWELFTDARCFLSAVEHRCNGSTAHKLHAVGLLSCVNGVIGVSPIAEVWTIDEPVTDYHLPHLFILSDGTEVRQAGPTFKERVLTGNKLVRKFPLPTMEVEARALIERVMLSGS